MFALKGRPSDHPVIVHLRVGEDLMRWSRDIPASRNGSQPLLAGRSRSSCAALLVS
jgi:tRNA A37 threonylcarbamoyladenosine synthetase subunit TsaC/SUA5/YrdC